jgi:hypothetical protein
MRNDIFRQSQLHQRDKANGVKHTPLHTLQECCEAAGIDYRWFGRVAAKHPDAPKPVLEHAKTAWRAGKKYYRKHEFVQWANQVRKQKENVMPDIKTALEKALSQTANAWAADDEAHKKTEPQQEKAMTLTVEQHDNRVATNISRITFEFIRDNPGLTNQEVTARLATRGFKETTISSLAYQMLRVRLIVADANGGLTAVVPEYEPIQTNIRRKRKVKAKPVKDAAPAPRKHVEIVNTRTGEVVNPKVTTAMYTTPAEWSVESVIGGLNVRQAMAVYDELSKIFGAMK